MSSAKDAPAASGAELIAVTLKKQNVDVVFGIVGIPVVEIAEACVAHGIRFIAFRNEQSAAYAASAYGYLSGRPGVCLTVGGPGVVHALAGLLNAKLNCWPLVLLSGSCDSDQVDMGAFQELDQVEACKPYCKYAARPTAIDRIPFVIEKALRTAFYGRPGATYVDFPADFIQYPIRHRESIERVQMPAVPNAPMSQAFESDLQEALSLLNNAKRPLIVLGKGAAYARAEYEIRQLVEATQIPFLPTPMGKGVVSDTHPLCVSAARSKALKEADVVLLIGARLNWILHYGHSPRWSSSVRYIHIDISPEEIGNNGAPTLPLLGDIKAVVAQLLTQRLRRLSSQDAYVKGLRDKVEQNIAKMKANGQKGTDTSILNYHTAFTVIKDLLPTDEVIYVSEGANTMDIARSYFDVHEPRHRLDAGTGATMGVGMGYAIAAQQYYPNKRIVSIVGDSAFGFSAMELETAIRSNMPLLIIVINNNGIYHGLDKGEYEESRNKGTLPTTSLSPETRYEQIAEACGGKGWLVKNRVELRKALQEAMALKNETCVINTLIAPGGRTKLEFGWMSKAEKAKM
ncbi:thiamine pyrophosphate enzyme, N-terminal TPP binding domain-containing protein [Radiomyces spectabilis]|uniref:thiamine pyrophosphate enzyme, N-terminal TPP binding domain-containing protein n=1 Tax=Radiomyces spectabilis TaxID=64574 RepID=UPI00221F5943|nr:thiamine pyrophosphate enzyme, N-terminal TPP binding domain-containing protein [Radiomyces spectabilis]KAI8368270.1 thiamine pyrophosphate enzyme, N-terminal TPP binding domain-containing protein [Radiomyces spectabilis]